MAYDGTNATNFMTPSLTTICQPFQALANEAVRIMMQLIQGEPVAEKHVIIPVTLRRGHTTDNTAAPTAAQT